MHDENSGSGGGPASASHATLPSTFHFTDDKEIQMTTGSMNRHATEIRRTVCAALSMVLTAGMPRAAHAQNVTPFVVPANLEVPTPNQSFPSVMASVRRITFACRLRPLDASPGRCSHPRPRCSTTSESNGLRISSARIPLRGASYAQPGKIPGTRARCGPARSLLRQTRTSSDETQYPGCYCKSLEARQAQQEDTRYPARRSFSE
jgi:hypothetical protein